jgi:predicted 3-demethylubiquinone-9 3-methyltransferase (glyoxalase superfamily)
MRSIATCLWFDDRAEEAARFYISVFQNSEITAITRKPAGTVMTVEFSLKGHPFIALNGGPVFKFTEAVSMVVICDTQEEVDEYWEKLTDRGKGSDCGWLQDRYGLSWQIVPTAVSEMARAKDLTKVNRMMAAMLKMKKIDLAKLRQAFDG